MVAGMTRASNQASVPSAPPQRTERPANRPERSERPSAANNERSNPASRAMEELAESQNSVQANNMRSPLAAPRAGERSARPVANQRRPVEDEDDFGDTDVTSLLG